MASATIDTTDKFVRVCSKVGLYVIDFKRSDERLRQTLTVVTRSDVVKELVAYLEHQRSLGMGSHTEDQYKNEDHDGYMKSISDFIDGKTDVVEIIDKYHHTGASSYDSDCYTPPACDGSSYTSYTSISFSPLSGIVS